MSWFFWGRFFGWGGVWDFIFLKTFLTILCHKPDGLLGKLFKRKVREPEEKNYSKRLSHHAERQEVSRFRTRGESEESIAHRRGSVQARVQPP